ncbi:MAG: MarR family winged helix-turn-helix transcriptional regulator [Clostridiales bacterium]|nr:MarR family winged helix-turn-helix transcriptional regulator [Clostridiales bacterium]
MVDEKRAIEFIESFVEGQPKRFFRDLDDNGKGLFAILRMLSVSGNETVAGDIASTLNMSTPRVASALRTLESRGLVLRMPSDLDARRTVVRITMGGREALLEKQAELAELVDFLMETVGESDMYEFLRISRAIGESLNKLADSVDEEK